MDHCITACWYDPEEVRQAFKDGTDPGELDVQECAVLQTPISLADPKAVEAEMQRLSKVAYAVGVVLEAAMDTAAHPFAYVKPMPHTIRLEDVPEG